MKKNRVFLNESKRTPEEKAFIEHLDEALGWGPLHGTNIGKQFEKKKPRKHKILELGRT